MLQHNHSSLTCSMHTSICLFRLHSSWFRFCQRIFRIYSVSSWENQLLIVPGALWDRSRQILSSICCQSALPCVSIASYLLVKNNNSGFQLIKWNYWCWMLVLCILVYLILVLSAHWPCPRCVRFVTGVASATSAIPYTCAQYHSSTVALACYMSRATLLRCWGKQ